MSELPWVLTLVLAGVLGVAIVRTRSRLARAEGRLEQLEQLVHAELQPGLVAAQVDARAAALTARDAAIAAGVAAPPPRLPLEAVTGPVVRAVAFGASARRAIARAAIPSWGQRREHRRSA
jgi:hypothetical protein